jgi:hypothetical protein
VWRTYPLRDKNETRAYDCLCPPSRDAPTFLDEVRDPDALQIDLDSLSGFDRPVLLTSGTESAPFFGPVVDMVADPLPRAERVPDRYVELVSAFTRTERSGAPG